MAYITTTLRPALFGNLGSALQRLREAFERRRVYRSTVLELSQLNDRELNDIGISRTQIDSIAHQHAYGN